VPYAETVVYVLRGDMFTLFRWRTKFTDLICIIYSGFCISKIRPINIGWFLTEIFKNKVLVLDFCDTVYIWEMWFDAVSQLMIFSICRSDWSKKNAVAMVYWNHNIWWVSDHADGVHIWRLNTQAFCSRAFLIISTWYNYWVIFIA